MEDTQSTQLTATYEIVMEKRTLNVNKQIKSFKKDSPKSQSPPLQLDLIKEVGKGIEHRKEIEEGK